MRPFVTCFRGVAHPWLCDRLGHLNTRNYFAALDDAMQHFFGILGYFPDASHGWADVQHTISYKTEIPLGALFHIDSALIRVGSKAISFKQRVLLTETGEVAAECDSTTVLLDLQERVAVPLPKILAENSVMYILEDQH